ncbi:MAG: YggS family pyridoxal phosphate-dependent enzyme, partial [Armatimonadetes bacterium]|nr:YggS family pyridoxal phosphate-dependent enzyme [Armatimonadota bacterium]
VLLVAVTKTHPPETVLEAARAGLTDFGENYVQELLHKKDAVEAALGHQVRWHFIGHLQRNKAKYLVPFCYLIHSIDSVRVAEELENRARAIGRRQPVLVEVNISGETSKYGVAPGEVPRLVEHILGLEHVELQGLMTMAPYSPDPEASRPIYARLRELRDELVGLGVPHEAVRHLSMGMSQDFEVAVEEGATIVRIGTAIFGERRH